MANKRDNLSKDVIAAQRLGYGIHYGHYKADHPYTKEGDDTREYARCLECGRLFYPLRKNHVYCSQPCGDRRRKRGQNAAKRAEVV